MLRSTRPLIAARPVRAALSASSTARARSSFPNLARPTTPSRLALAAQPSLRYTTKSPSGFQSGRDPEEEKKFGAQKLESHPESVTTDSSVRHAWEPREGGQQEPDLKKGIADELDTVKQTFALSSVPKESYALGLAGTIPYLFTSVSTVYLSWDLNQTWPSTSSLANSLMVSHETAHQWLAILEPMQLGYGAVIISFLGAIHWGLEYAERKPDLARTRFRYGIGVLAPAVAWPTLLMPLPFALTSQFAAFVGLYFADSRAAVKGWAPSWYGTYRFVLTAVVGVSLVISLIGRAKVGDDHLSGLDQKINPRGAEQTYDEKWAKREAEDKARMKQEAEEAEKKKKAEEKKAKKEEGKKSATNEKEENKEKKDEQATEKKDNKSEEKKEEKADEKPQEKGDDKKDDQKDDKKTEKSEDNKGEKQDSKQGEKQDEKKGEQQGEKKAEKQDDKEGAKKDEGEGKEGKKDEGDNKENKE